MSSTFGSNRLPASAPRWVIPFRNVGPFTLRLFCFPHSGAGASLFASWSKLLPSDIQVCGVQLPGREDRLSERPLTDVQTAVTQLAGALQAWQDRPFAFFGHSLGAALAYEVALRLQCSQAQRPMHIFASGRLPPSVPSPVAAISSLPDADFLRELRRRYGRSSEAFWANRELVDFFLPVLRADLRLAESDGFTKDGCLECPLTAFGGTEDEILPEQLHEWKSHTSHAFQLKMIAGDHGFVTTARVQLAGEIDRCLTSRAPVCESS